MKGNRTSGTGDKKKESSEENEEWKEVKARESKMNMKKTGKTRNEEMTMNGGNKKDEGSK